MSPREVIHSHLRRLVLLPEDSFFLKIINKTDFLSFNLIHWLCKKRFLTLSRGFTGKEEKKREGKRRKEGKFRFPFMCVFMMLFSSCFTLLTIEFLEWLPLQISCFLFLSLLMPVSSSLSGAESLEQSTECPLSSLSSLFLWVEMLSQSVSHPPSFFLFKVRNSCWVCFPD